MIDFTNALEELNSYKGSEKKKTLIYNNKKYLVKFPDPVREKNKNISYINNAFSEYIGSNIFKICGFKVQNTILGKYNYNGKEKIVCACEDFTNIDNILYEFENLALSTNLDKKIETELKNLAINCYSCLKEEGKKINYMAYIKQMKNKECNNAIKRLFLNINMDTINKFIDNVEGMSLVRKEFYKRILEKRYEILKEVYENITRGFLDELNPKS